jgi:choline dehydrogenase-like flavoprotein
MLSHPEDQRCIVEAMKIARRIVGHPAMGRHVVTELAPGPSVQTDDEWLEFGRINAQTIYHPIGTCRMGEDDEAVVDPQLRVRGLQGLRVIDASVIPRMVSGNTQVAVLVVAERGAELVLQSAG